MTKVLSYTEFKDYFKSLAEGHKLLNPSNTVGAAHFYEFTEDFAGTQLKPLCMVLLPPINSPKDDLSDNVMKRFDVEFWILQIVAKQSTSGRIAALELCERVGWDIIRRIKKHNKDYSLGVNRPVQQFDLSDVRWEQIQPAKHQDNYHGYSFEFNFSNPIQITDTEANWW